MGGGWVRWKQIVGCRIVEIFIGERRVDRGSWIVKLERQCKEKKTSRVSVCISIAENVCSYKKPQRSWG